MRYNAFTPDAEAGYWSSRHEDAKKSTKQSSGDRRNVP